MRISQCRSLGLLIAVVITLSTIVVGTQQSVAATDSSQLSWKPCYRELGFAFECGRLQVPLDYDDADASTIVIALVRLPATDPARRIGSLFLNPGGPGGSGVEMALTTGPYLYSDQVRAAFDIVGFDPRGIGRSTPLRCFGSPQQWEPWFLPFPFPETPQQEADWGAADRWLASACDLRGGRIIDHMSSANVARDLDRLRAAVGDDRLTYLGLSYGSLLGVTYANLFPDRVRALVLDGVIDPIALTTGTGDEHRTVPYWNRIGSDQGARDTLEEFFRLCDLATTGCALAPGAADRFAALIDHLRTHGPIQFRDPATGDVIAVDHSLLIWFTLGSLYDSRAWPPLAQLLAELEAQSGPDQLATAFGAFVAATGYLHGRGDRYPNLIEAPPGVTCSDTDNPDTHRAWSVHAATAEARHGYFGRPWTWLSSICAVWPGVDADRYTGPFNARTANPILLIGNTFDPATRYEGAVAVANLLPRSRLLTVHGWGHVSLGTSQCADDAATAYLLTTAPPAPGTVCHQDDAPFATATQVESSRSELRTAVLTAAVPRR